MEPSPATPPRVVLYGRVSKDDRDGLSPAGQLAGLREWAHRTGRTVVAELRDDGIGASRFTRVKVRPDWLRALELITTGQTDELAVREVSRGTRDRTGWANLMDACIAAGVDVVLDGKVLDPADPDDAFMLDLGAAQAVQLAGKISKTTRDGKRQAAARGRPAGTLPYGYRRVLDPITGKATAREIDPEQGPIFQEIVTRLLAEESAEAIARDLNRRGVPTGTRAHRWLGQQLEGFARTYPSHPVAVEITRRLSGDRPEHVSTVAADLNSRGVAKPVASQWRGTNLGKMVCRPVYAGLRVYRDEVQAGVEGQWPPLVSETDHLRLLALFDSPDRARYRRSTSAIRHLGTGLYRCGRPGCDGSMRVVVGASVGRANRYDCRTCHKVSRNQAPVDQLVESLMIARLSRPDVMDLLAELADDHAAKEAAAEVDRLKGKLRELREKVDAEELTLDDLAYFRKRWEPQLAEAEARARPRSLPPVVWDVAGPDAAAHWDATPIGGRRTILGALFTVMIHPTTLRGAPFDPDLITVDWRGKAV